MRYTMIFLSIMFFGCSPEQHQKASAEWFDLQNILDELVVNTGSKNSRTTKTFILNSDSETKNYNSTDSTFWAKELSKLKEIDLNSPQIRDVLKMTSGIKDDQSNLLIDDYLMPDKNTSTLRRLSIYYLEDATEVRKIYAELNSDNLISNSGTKIHLWINRYDNRLLIDSLQIIGCDKTFMQSEREYQITTKSVW
jgi:hypothetical protein